MGSVSDPRGSVEFRFSRVGDGDYVEIQPPESPRLANVRLAVPGWSRQSHHVAMLDRSGDLMLAPDDATLWRKLREKMSCPTLEGWGDALIPHVHLSGLLLSCESFGTPDPAGPKMPRFAHKAIDGGDVRFMRSFRYRSNASAKLRKETENPIVSTRMKIPSATAQERDV
jgi:hypothetical protein